MKKIRTFCCSTIEPLEYRIAPAAVSLTYTDLNGELVKVTASHGDLTLGDLTMTSVGHGSQLEELNLSDSSFEGASITIAVTSAAKNASGGFVNVGYIDAGGNNLGSVTVDGDLGEITAGSGSSTTPALGSLTVHSMGVLGTATGASGQVSEINGSVGPVKIAGDLGNVMLATESSGSLASLTIGGSLLGSAAANSACVSVAGSIGLVKIGGNIIGGGSGSGAIEAGGTLAGITVGGSLIGGSGSGSGLISSGGNMGPVVLGGSIEGGSIFVTGAINSGGEIKSLTVKGSLIGGAGNNSGEITASSAIQTISITGSVVGGGGVESGQIDASSSISTLSIGGSLLGGAGDESGYVASNSGINAVHIGHDIVGGFGSGFLVHSGEIASGASIQTVTVGGSVLAGAAIGGGLVSYNGAIVAGKNIGTLTVGGSLLGSGVNPVIISAGGLANVSAKATFDPAIGQLTVGGDVEYANILATDGGAGIGSVKVSGDWVASNLAAGVQNNGSTVDANFGDSNDALVANAGSLIGKIESITIGGEIDGVPGGSGHFGFVAAAIGSMKIGASALALPGPGDFLQLSLLTGDVAVHVLG